MHPFVLLGVGLVAVLSFTTFAGIWHHNYELSHQVQKISSQPAAQQITLASADSQEVSIQNTVSSAGTTPAAIPKKSAPHINSQQNTQPVQNNPVANQNPNPASAPTPIAVTVKLSINSIYKGDVSLPETSTQCDILQKALEAGVISSLDMRYSSQYKTYAVYAINGQGDSGAIWWTFAVNGKSPPYGCSGTNVAAGDSVNWKYVKQ